MQWLNIWVSGTLMYSLTNQILILKILKNEVLQPLQIWLEFEV